MPDALQKWHETSKNLEKNQTVLHGSILEIQQLMKNFSIEVRICYVFSTKYSNKKKLNLFSVNSTKRKC